MKSSKFLVIAALSAITLNFSQFSLADHHGGAMAKNLADWSQGEHRSETNRARNQFRHPIAPNASASYMPRILSGFEEKITADPDLYGKITVRHLNPPHEVAIAPPGSADMALTFRNVHNWIMAGQEHEFFASFYAALKPGGVLGVVEHRAKADAGMDVMRTSGYVTEAYVKEVAAAAGFEFVASTEINANPKDPTVHPEGVWTLAPNYRLGDVDRAKYDAIGESDRMTLKFVKPL